MVKEIIISIYLCLFKLIFNIFKLFPLKKKTTFVISFKQNSMFLYNQMRRQGITDQVIFLCKNCKLDLADGNDHKIIGFETKNPINLIKAIYHLATSNNVIVDNYFGFLSAINFKKQVQCVQLWHAVGAIKNFGLKDHSVKQRSKVALRRFLDVYKRFDKIIVGSEAMAKIFIKAFNISSDNILRTGIPRTDLFFDNEAQKRIIQKLYNENQNLKEKKVILYAPTYRDYEINHFDLKLNIERMYQALHDEYVLLLKCHPVVKKHTHLDQYPGFVYDYSDYPDVNELLLITDILITDYSSIPHEFSLLNRPMIFFPYDLDEYEKSRGLWDKFNEMVPEPIVYSTDDVIKCIKSGKFNYEQIKSFSSKWNQYSLGHSSYNLVNYLFIKTPSIARNSKEKVGV